MISKLFKNVFVLLAFSGLTFSVGAQAKFSVMSYNIRLSTPVDKENYWELRKDKVATLINYYEPSFLGLQEVLQSQLDYLDCSLKGYSYIGVGRDDGKQGGEYSCLFYKSDDYTVLEQGTFWLSPTPQSVTIGWDAAYKRVCTYGLFENKKTKKKLWVFNTHFDHIGVTARKESMKLIVEKIKAINKKNYPSILTGDFNMTPNEEPIKWMSEKMEDTRTKAQLVKGGAETFNAFKFLEPVKTRIDYIFMSKNSGLIVSKYATISDSYDLKYPSDHLPVMANFIYKK